VVKMLSKKTFRDWAPSSGTTQNSQRNATDQACSKKRLFLTTTYPFQAVLPAGRLITVSG